MSIYIIKIPDHEEVQIEIRIREVFGDNKIATEEYIINAVANFFKPEPERPYDSTIEVFKLM